MFFTVVETAAGSLSSELTVKNRAKQFSHVINYNCYLKPELVLRGVFVVINVTNPIAYCITII